MDTLDSCGGPVTPNTIITGFVLVPLRHKMFPKFPFESLTKYKFFADSKRQMNNKSSTF